jgi:hypothetical protein
MTKELNTKIYGLVPIVCAETSEKKKNKIVNRVDNIEPIFFM